MHCLIRKLKIAKRYGAGRNALNQLTEEHLMCNDKSNVALLAAIQSHDAQHGILLQNATSYMKDKTLPLGDRWAVFLRIEEWLPLEPWCVHIDDPEVVSAIFTRGEEDWYGAFHLDRCATMEYTDLDEMMHEHEKDDKRDIVREWILEGGQRGFINDW